MSICVCLNMCLRVCVSVCVYTFFGGVLDVSRMYTRTFIYIYTHTHTPARTQAQTHDTNRHIVLHDPVRTVCSTKK